MYVSPSLFEQISRTTKKAFYIKASQRCFQTHLMPTSHDPNPHTHKIKHSDRSVQSL